MPEETTSTTSTTETQDTAITEQVSPSAAGEDDGDSFVNELLGLDARRETAPAGSTPAAQGNSTESTETGTVDSATEEAIQRLADELGFDINDPTNRKVLERLARAEAGGTQAPQQQQQEQTENGDADDDIPTDLLLEGILGESKGTEQQGEPDAGQTKGEQQQAATEPQPWFPGDVGAAWKDEVEGLTALNEAYASGDMAKVRDVQRAYNMREFVAHQMPLVQRMVEGLLRENFGDVLAERQMQRQREEDDQIRSQVVTRLANLPQYKELQNLFVPTDDKMITFRGEKYPNTPYNRTIAKNPALLDIRVEHANPKAARALSYARKYAMVAKLAKAENAHSPAIPPHAAKEILEAGREIAVREQTEESRRTFNAGRSGGSTGSTGDGDDYVRSITGSAGRRGGFFG